MKPQLKIRADGSSTIGLGHIVRCSALANMLKGDFQITFFCKKIPDTLAGEIEVAGFALKIIEAEEEFFKTMKPNQVAVIDGYGFDTDYQRKVRESGCKLVYIDDLHNQEFVADLIINHAPGITPQGYKAQPYTRFALGLKYVLLRPAFLEQAKRVRKIEEIETLLIAFGGADPKRLTEKALKTALEFKQFKKIIVVIGVAFETSDDFLQLLESDRRIECRCALNEEKMLNTMLESDLAILPASGILFEALAVGCYVISGYFTSNQTNIHSGFKNLGLIFDGDSFQDIKTNLNAFLNNFKAKSNHQIINGQSGIQLKRIFKSLINV